MNFKNICKKGFKGKLVSNNICKVNGINLRNEPSFFEYKTQSQQYKVMKPKEFLDVVPPEPFKNKKLQKKIANSIGKGEPISPPFLDIDVDSCKVLGHEGRNRAISSKRLGLRKYPVTIYNKEFDKDAVGMFGKKGVYSYTERKNKCKKFVRQDY